MWLFFKIRERVFCKFKWPCKVSKIYADSYALGSLPLKPLDDSWMASVGGEILLEVQNTISGDFIRKERLGTLGRSEDLMCWGDLL
jgi:hypothetical protein